MKEITVTDEVYEFLINLSKEIKNQDNRGTRSPYYYQVQETKSIPTGPEFGEEVWVLDGEICLRTDEEIKSAVFDYKGWNMRNKEHQDEYDKLSSYDVENILSMNYRKVFIDTIEVYSNVFFTEKACHDYIGRNKHNLNNPKSYLFYADRNYEMDMLIKFLETLTEQIK